MIKSSDFRRGYFKFSRLPMQIGVASGNDDNITLALTVLKKEAYVLKIRFMISDNCR